MLEYARGYTTLEDQGSRDLLYSCWLGFSNVCRKVAIDCREMDGREAQGLERDGKIENEGGEGLGMKSEGRRKPARSFLTDSSCKLPTVRVEECRSFVHALH